MCTQVQTRKGTAAPSGDPLTGTVINDHRNLRTLKRTGVSPGQKRGAGFAGSRSGESAGSSFAFAIPVMGPAAPTTTARRGSGPPTRA